jgi:hypothetical protein
MTFFAGHTGIIRLKRQSASTINASIDTDSINTSLNRFGFDGSEDNLITGDQLLIETEDARGLVFLDASAWPDGGGQILSSYRAYANVNALGGIRLYPTFEDAVNNTRASEISLTSFAGANLPIVISLRDGRANILGGVTGFEINTDRAALDITSLSDNFRQQYSAGILSGNGSIECLFEYDLAASQETPYFLLQVINRLDVGSQIDAILSLSSIELNASFTEEVFYEISAVITRAGVNVTSDALVSCSIDFVTTGEFKLKVGVPSDYILQEDDSLIELNTGEATIDYLLQEVTD